MRQLPREVERLRRKFAQNAELRREFGNAACKLLQCEPDLVALWTAVEKRTEERDPWVLIFLGFVRDAAALPPFHYLTAAQRRALASEIERLSRRLARYLTENELDAQLFYSDSINSPGFCLYDDFSESNRAHIDDAGTEKVPVSRIVLQVGKRAKELITREPIRGKAGKNADAIRFARMLSDKVKGYYGQPLLSVVMTATNVIFGTNYNQGDIQNLLAR